MKVALLCLLLAQAADPIPDALKLSIARAHRDQLAAATAMQTAMQQYHAAEQKFARAKHDLDVATYEAAKACGPHLGFDLERISCVAGDK